MRGATTALTNVLHSHPQVSGYGETHVSYMDGHGPGRLAVNLILRGALKFHAPSMLDKVLHSHLDRKPEGAFYTARAVFLLRSPSATIHSIMRLVQRGELPEIADEADAARYYVQRTQVLARHWKQFSPDRRLGLTTEDLLADPSAAVATLGRWLQLVPDLQNQYRAHALSARPGVGDTTFSAQAQRIEPRISASNSAVMVGVPEEWAAQCYAAHAQLLARFRASASPARETVNPFSRPRPEGG